MTGPIFYLNLNLKKNICFLYFNGRYFNRFGILRNHENEANFLLFLDD